MASETKKGEIEGLDDGMIPAMIEVGFLSAAADGELGDQEGATLAAVLGALFGDSLTPDQIERQVVECATALNESDLTSRLANLGTRLTTPSARRTALALSASVLLSEGGVSDGEGNIYGRIAAHLGVEDDDAVQIFKDVAVRMSA
jgi:uncharacterized tellurite resistance protein B-like protein